MLLAEFLTARLDEDEGYARSAASFVTSAAWTSPPSDAQAIHIARHEPARVLAEVEAKRRIVQAHTPQGPDMHGAVCCPVCVDWTQADVDNLAEMYPCTTLRLLALPYADHADWREEWRPC